MTAVSHMKTSPAKTLHHRRAAIDDHPSILADIYGADVNIAIWMRNLSQQISADVENFLDQVSHYQKTFIASPEDIYSKLTSDDEELCRSQALCQDITELVELFCFLFDRKKVGLRITKLNKAMCPRFHVDRVPCRLVCTYQGVASQWLPHNLINRSKLGVGSNGLVDQQSGLYQSDEDIQQMNVGDVSILKGELWEGNENAGLVHRSPEVPPEQSRLLVTIDFND